jgi:hypothetical protein
MKVETLIHDINSSISALLSSMELINDEWRNNPELVDKIIPLTKEKISELELLLKEYRSINR